MTQSQNNLSQAGKLAGKLPGLLMQAEKVAQSFMRGVHGRRRVGMGESFWQFRPYQPGDARRDIDWRQTAKRDTAFVRQTEWEAAQTIWLYRDGSASMGSKKDYAEILLLALGMVLLNGGEQVGLLGTSLAPQMGYPSISRIYESLPAQKHLEGGARPVAAKSHVILISDFYFPLAALNSFCENLAAQHVTGTLVQVFAPEEQTLPHSGRVKFLDTEDAEAAPLDIPQVEAVRAEYEQKFIAHQQALADLAKNTGWTFEKFSTDTKPEAVLAQLYDDLSVKK